MKINPEKSGFIYGKSNKQTKKSHEKSKHTIASNKHGFDKLRAKGSGLAVIHRDNIFGEYAAHIFREINLKNNGDS